LLVLKLQLGRLVKEPPLLKEEKKLFPTVVTLLILKLQDGRVVSDPP